MFPENLSAIADVDKKLYEIGFEPDEDYIEQTYGRKWKKRSAPQPAAPDQAAFAERDETSSEMARDRARAADDQDELDVAAEALAGKWEEFLGPRLDELRALLDETDDLELFGRRLAELLARAPVPGLVETLARSQFAANLFGRARGKTGNK